MGLYTGQGDLRVIGRRVRTWSGFTRLGDQSVLLLQAGGGPAESLLMRPLSRSLTAPLLAAALVLLSGCGATDALQASATTAPLPLPCTDRTPRLQPAGGVLLGVDLDWAADSAAGFSERTRTRPAVLSAFVPFALERDDVALVDRVVDELVAQRSALMLTVEPFDGLAAVDERGAARLARRVAGWSERGVPVYVRFGQEMNGSWYPWGQQPQEYVRAFRTVADAVHRAAPLAAMVWAPNYAVGYPFRDGRQQFDRSDPVLGQLDTDDDGALTRADDPYAPYWPGAAAVDWVGTSLFHWGDGYPWDRQTVPEEGKFLAQLTGTYGGASGTVAQLPDFVQTYSVGHGKPFAVTETAARWSPGQPGPSPELMRQAWLAQVFSPEVLAAVPTLRMVTWLDWRRREPETRTTVDWRISSEPRAAAGFRRAVSGLRQAGDLGLCLPQA